jgi:RNA polymerase sigma-70 factor (ECF subfamily)
MLQTDGADLIRRALGQLPARFRELLVLRELEGLSYREMADVMGVPMGTIMSGLSRARQAFRDVWGTPLEHSGASRKTHAREHDTSEVLV